jgi:hypothetical protein
MNADELDEMRTYLMYWEEGPEGERGAGDYINPKAAIQDLLTHIDQQEQGIGNLQTALVSRDQIIASQTKQIHKLQDTRNEWIKIFNDKDEQIETLKAALIKERFWSIWRKINKSVDADVEKTTVKARKQLANEMPEIFGEE